jgi:hypothetical protein
VILSLVGHGSGWSANALPGQPSKWRPQPDGAEHEERIGGLLWDDSPGDGGTSRSLSTKALAYALGEIGRSIDLLYLDACSMGMVEVAYEVRNSVDYLLASPNTDWASYPYNTLLQRVSSDKSAAEIGKSWVAAEAAVLRSGSYPFTLSLYNLQQMDSLMDALGVLGSALTVTLANDRVPVEQAARDSDRYESIYDGSIAISDTYVDLQSFALHLAKKLGSKPVLMSAVEDVKTALTTVVIERQFADGRPWLYPDSEWHWSETACGIGIFLPVPADEPKRALYTDQNLLWAKDTTWDEFLAAYWNNVDVQKAAFQADPLPTCQSTRSCLDLPKPLRQIEGKVYLPIIARGN